MRRREVERWRDGEMAIWDRGLTAVNGADKKWKRRKRGEDEADATLGNWFICTEGENPSPFL